MKLQSVQAILRGALAAARNPRLLAKLAVMEASQSEQLWESQVRHRLGGVPGTVPIEQLIHAEGDTLNLFSFLDDTSTVPDLLLLRSFISRFQQGRFFEVGTFRGESAIAVADIADEVVTLSLSDDQIAAMGADKTFVAAHRFFSEGHPKIRHIFGDSRTVNLAEYQAWADLIFIDGDHSYNAVVSDTRRFWSLRRSENSIVVWHDAYYSPLVPRWEVLAGIVEGLPEQYHKGLVHVSNTLCMAWLPEADALPTIDDSYIPRLAFSVEVVPQFALPKTSAKEKSTINS